MFYPPPSSAASRREAAEDRVSSPATGGESWPETDHSALTKLHSGSAAEKEAALRQLFGAYAQPLRRYIRHHWPQLPETSIDDLASEFLARCLTGDKAHFLAYDPDWSGSPVRLRTYLRAILGNFLRNQHRNAHTLVRGGNRRFESLDTIHPAAHQEAPVDGTGPLAGVDIEAYDRHWAHHIINLSFLALENATPATREWLPVLRPWILADPGDNTLKELARDKGCTHAAVRTHLHRLRKAWRQAVRHAVGQTVVDPADIDDELRHLAAVLSRHPLE